MGTHRYAKTKRNLPGENFECVYCGLRRNTVLDAHTYSYGVIPLSFVEPECISTLFDSLDDNEDIYNYRPTPTKEFWQHYRKNPNNKQNEKTQ